MCWEPPARGRGTSGDVRCLTLRRLATWALVVAAALVVGCGDGGAARSGAPVATPSAQQRGPILDRRPLLRTCATSVYGALGRHFRRGGVTLGPVTFIGLREWAHNFPSRRNGRLFLLKVLVVVDNGARVTVVIPRSARRTGGLDYELGSAARRIAGAQSAVTFKACAPGRSGPSGGDGRRTQFAGYFVVTRRRCLPVLVAQAPGAPVRRIVVSLGAGRCAPG